MSDVPATAWWALSLALLAWNRGGTALAAGVAAGLAVITRPNLVPLALVPALVLAVTAARERNLAGPGSRRLMLFGAGAAPAIVALGLINARLYGSPFITGYGSLRDFYSWSYLVPNLARYPLWILQDTPIVLLAAAAPFTVSRWRQRGSIGPPRAVAISWLGFCLAVLLSYVFYRPFEDARSLRFLLPAFPPLFVLTVAALAGLLRPLGRAAPVLVMIIVSAVSLGRAHSAMERRIFERAGSEQHYVDIGRYVASRLPERAVFISMQHSGSLRYYSGRLTLRYDWILRQRLEWLVTELRRLGYHPYILLEEWEVPRFRAKFQDSTPLGALDWPPRAVHRRSGSSIYDPADQQAAREGRSIPTDVIR
jgi:hypothetical protein